MVDAAAKELLQRLLEKYALQKEYLVEGVEEQGATMKQEATPDQMTSLPIEEGVVVLAPSFPAQEEQPLPQQASQQQARARRQQASAAEVAFLGPQGFGAAARQPLPEAQRARAGAACASEVSARLARREDQGLVGHLEVA